MKEKKYAGVIVDISHEALDRTFEYKIPNELREVISEGMEVEIPFGAGNKIRSAYVVSISDTSVWPEEKLKSIVAIKSKNISLEDKTMELAYWMKHRYGCTLISAMQTVLPVKKKVKALEYKTIYRNVDISLLEELIKGANPYRAAARIRLMSYLMEGEYIPYDLAKDKLNVSDSVIKTLEKNKVIRIETTREYRKPAITMKAASKNIVLSDEQVAAIEGMKAKMVSDKPGTALLYGITGSGKTTVYIELIEEAIKNGKQAIVLIPEIALTFQMLMNFYERFGERVAVMHSKLSDGEKFDQYEQARNGKIDIVIGPRSALFTPFRNLGIIVIDEEHETSYKSEKMPKYNAREVASHIADRDGALLVLGSATPSLESYYASLEGEYDIFRLTKRNGKAMLPKVHTVDMRRELKEGNKSFFSRKLKELMTERIARGQQIMLFINRRGYAGFVSCRECGYVMKCPHCDVSLSHHKSGQQETMVCHYCGYETPYLKTCPKCGSKYFAGFRAGTEKIEEELKKEYPSIRILRMDRDTTRSKEDYDKILSAFAAKEADVLIGTQMIVKGHDFPGVTLVGVVAADLSLSASDYRASERTFQLITQCAGRAGRGDQPGDVVIQTYRPDDYSIVHASKQDYEAFYEEEILYRSLADYPPVCHMLSLQIMSDNDSQAGEFAKKLADYIRDITSDDYMVNGPARGALTKVNDIYRYVIYIKHDNIDKLISLKDNIEDCGIMDNYKKVSLWYDFDPSGSF